MTNSTTTFENKCKILSDFWIEYKNTGDFGDFIDYNDLGLPLAFALSTGLVTAQPMAETYINETWDLLLGALDIKDTGFEDIEEILGFEEG